MVIKEYPDDCPFSVDGICESDSICPHGCDDKYGDIEKEYEIQHSLHLQRLRSDYVYVILRLLIESGWIAEFERLNAPLYLIESHIESRKIVRGFANSWIIEQYEIHWTKFYKDMTMRDRFAVSADWEIKLYSLYYPSLKDGTMN
jgi:hypothetical protein